MVSRNNKRTRNRNKKSKNKRERRKKSMNKYKRSLKKQRVRRTKNKKLQRGGLIIISTQAPDAKDRFETRNFEGTFNKKNMQFYNAYYVAFENPELLNPESMDGEGENHPLSANFRGKENLDPYKMEISIQDRENSANHLKFGLMRHSESEANWLLKVAGMKLNELYYGYVTPFLTPYGRSLAYSTGYYKYADHIMNMIPDNPTPDFDIENLEFYSSTLPRSMITAMLVLRGIIDRLKQEEKYCQIEGKKRKLGELIQTYSSKEIKVCYGISEEPVGPHYNAASNSYAQRIMSAEMMEPMVKFINDTECGDTQIMLVLGEEHDGKQRPYFWKEGDNKDAYMSSNDTLNRFFYNLYTLQKGNVRHIFVVHGIIMEKYVSWPFFTEFLKSLGESVEAGGGASRGGGAKINQEGGSTGESSDPQETRASSWVSLAEPPVTETGDEEFVRVSRVMKYEPLTMLKSMLEQFHNILTISDDVLEMEDKWSKILFLGGYKIETLRDMVKQLCRRHRHLTESEFTGQLDDIQEEYKGFFLKLLELMTQLSPELLIQQSKEDIEKDKGSMQGDGVNFSSFNKLLESIGDPRWIDSDWFNEHCRGFFGGISPEDKLNKFKEAWEGPIGKTPNNCSSVFGTLICGAPGGSYEDTDTEEKKDDRRNLYLLYALKDVQFMSPTLRFQVCPTSVSNSNSRYYNTLLSIISQNTPDKTHQTDEMIMNLFKQEEALGDKGEIIAKGIVYKQKPTARDLVNWPKRFAVLRGNGIYFYDVDDSDNPKGNPRGSSVENIRSATSVTLVDETFSKGVLSGKENREPGASNWRISEDRPMIKIEFKNEGEAVKSIDGQTVKEIKFAFMEPSTRYINPYGDAANFKNNLDLLIYGNPNRDVAGVEESRSMAGNADDLQPEPENIYRNRWIDEISRSNDKFAWQTSFLKDRLDHAGELTLRGLGKNKISDAITAVSQSLRDPDFRTNFNTHLQCLPDYQTSECQELKTAEIEKILTEAKNSEV